MLANEISHFIELNKRAAELVFKKNYLLAKGKKKEDIQIISLELENNEINEQKIELEKTIRAKGIVLFYPYENEINKLNLELAKLEQSEIYKAMETKQGEVYELIKNRGKFIKENFENRNEISALIELVNSLPADIRTETIEKTKAGNINGLNVSTLDAQTRIKLFKLLNRSGIRCVIDSCKLAFATESKLGIVWDEKPIELNRTRVWVAEKNEEKMRKMINELGETSRAIQVMNAENEIKKFSANEQNIFAGLQKKYLDLMHQRDKLIEE